MNVSTRASRSDASCVLGILLSIAALLAPGAARADDDTRLGPGATSADAPGTAQKSQPTPHLSFTVALRPGYNQRAATQDWVSVVRHGELQLQITFGLFDWIELGLSIAGRLQLAGGAAIETAEVPARRASLLPVWAYAKLAIPGLRRPHHGEGWGAALETAVRVPIDGDPDPRIAVWPRFIVDVRTSWGLLVALDIAVPFRLADKVRPTRLALDLNLGFSQLLIQRIDLHLFASGRIRIPLGNSFGESDLLPSTILMGFTFGSPDEAYVQLGAALDLPPLSGPWDRLSWSALIQVGWLLGRARAAAKATANHEGADGVEEARRTKTSPVEKNLLAAPGPGARTCDWSQRGRDATLAVVRANELYLGSALAERGMEALEETVRGTMMGIGVTAMLVAATAYYQASMALTLKFLQWLGVGSLSMLAADRFTAVSGAFGECIATIAIACGDPAQIDLAARQYADAIARVTGAVGEALFFLAAAKGLDPLLKELEGTNLSKTLGLRRLREWMAEGVKRIKGERTAGSTKPPGATPRIAGPPRFTPPPVGEAPRLTPENAEQIIAYLKKHGGLKNAHMRQIRRVARTKNEKWNLPDTLRGRVSHALRGENLPQGFKCIDKVLYDADGEPIEVTSLKSLQPYAQSYRKPGALYNKFKTEIDVLAKFGGDVHGGVTIKMTPAIRRVLEFEVPPDTVGPELAGRPRGDPALREQMRAEAADAIRYAQTRSVELRFQAVKP